MFKKKIAFLAIFIMTAAYAAAQYTPWLSWTLIPKTQMDEIIGEASGETAWNTIAEINAFNRQRTDAEYAGNYFETMVVSGKLKQYGLAGVDILTYPGGEAWRAIKGELWEEKPIRQKIASINDMLPMLVAGSAKTDVTADLVWIGNGSVKEIMDAKVAGKIVVTEGNIMRAYTIGIKQGMLGLVAISRSRPYFDPQQMPWTSISMRGMGLEMMGGPAQAAQATEPKFAFQLPVREGDSLKQRLLAGARITVRAVVDSKMEKADLENVTCCIPGTDPKAGEIIFSAHLFEGFNKQGANDNISGSATILEVARVLNTLISEGRLPRPRRTIRFIWGSEFSGIGKWVKDNRQIMENTLCNINLDMVGEWLTKNKSFFNLMRTTYGDPHYINDVMENYYRFIGEGTRERIQNRTMSGQEALIRVVAPTGSDEPFYYSIETHYGASDHEVFNDWGVGVPGVMMIAWPDQWYHTSGDVVDKSDPTQLRRAAIIAAAGAYTVAAADADRASAIAAEIVSNATRRLGHVLAVGLDALNNAKAEALAGEYRFARWTAEAAVMNEKETLGSVTELAPSDKDLAAYVERQKKAIDEIGAGEATAIDEHMKVTARRLGVKPVRIVLTAGEKAAAGIVPRPTVRVKENGYDGYRKYIKDVPAAERKKFPLAGKGIFLADPAELQLLANGRHSALDILKMVDAQSEKRSTIEGVMNYLELLKLAGLLEW